MEFSQRLASSLLILATVVALVLANSPAGPAFLALCDTVVYGLSLREWVNDTGMTVFFLLVGLELKRELLVGELSTRDRALLPVLAAVGGIVVPAAIHFALNAGTPAARGFGIPMATDIAFTLGVLTALGPRIPPALRAFVIAFAVIDDLGAILVIALFYSGALAPAWLALMLGLWLVLVAMNRMFRVRVVTPYLLVGALLWWATLRSGLHPTLAGVLLASTIPLARERGRSPAMDLEHRLAGPVALVILPVFALANAGVAVSFGNLAAMADANALGILGGLVIGKPLGIGLACLLAVHVFRMQRPESLGTVHFLGAGLLGGIGFTMSIFIATLAFAGDPAVLDASKLAVLCASLISGLVGFAWLRLRA